jgi:hypothetical protein
MQKCPRELGGPFCSTFYFVYQAIVYNGFTSKPNAASVSGHSAAAGSPVGD